MDGASRRGTADRRRRPPQRTRRTDSRGGDDADQRRLLQLGVSLALFLLVYIGRGVFPAHLAAWQEAAAANVDFRAAFQQFGASMSQGVPVRSALEALCVTLMGGEAEMEPAPPSAAPEEPPRPMALLSQTAGGGLSYLGSHGILARTGFPTGDLKNDPSPPDSEPAQPEVATAVAQAYTSDGVKLPRNVSLDFYELGLSETAVPVDGAVTSGFGYRDSPINGKNEFHLALDIGAAEGAEIGAFAAGTVEYIGESDVYGQYLQLDHGNGVTSFYAHCSKLCVRQGQTVAAGEKVAESGATGEVTGPHLHFEMKKDGVRLNPAYYIRLLT